MNDSGVDGKWGDSDSGADAKGGDSGIDVAAEAPPSPKSLWCDACTAPASLECSRRHLTVLVQEALRAQVQTMVPCATDAVLGLEDAVRSMEDEAAQSAMRLLTGPPPSCRVALRQGDDEYSAQWKMEGCSAADGLARALHCQLALVGLLLQAKVARPISRLEEWPADAKDSLMPKAKPVRTTVTRELAREALDVETLSITDPDELQEAKKDIVERVRLGRVWRLCNVFCLKDPDWALALLEATAPHLEEVFLCWAGPSHLNALRAAPRLRRLQVYFDNSNAYEQAFAPYNADESVIVPLPHPWPGLGLEWLCVNAVRRATLLALLHAHAASLRVLWLDDASGADVDKSRELQALLRDVQVMSPRGGVGLARLERLVLWRCPGRSCDPDACRAQREAARSHLPAEARVQCTSCDELPCSEPDF